MVIRPVRRSNAIALSHSFLVTALTYKLHPSAGLVTIWSYQCNAINTYKCNSKHGGHYSADGKKVSLVFNPMFPPAQMVVDLMIFAKHNLFWFNSTDTITPRSIQILTRNGFKSEET